VAGAGVAPGAARPQFALRCLPRKRWERTKRARPLYALARRRLQAHC
jgi:hypothetical protein